MGGGAAQRGSGEHWKKEETHGNTHILVRSLFRMPFKESKQNRMDHDSTMMWLLEVLSFVFEVQGALSGGRSFRFRWFFGKIRASVDTGDHAWHELLLASWAPRFPQLHPSGTASLTRFFGQTEGVDQDGTNKNQWNGQWCDEFLKLMGPETS